MTENLLAFGLSFLIFYLKVRGYNGAKNIVRLMQQRDVKLSFVLDEGLGILDGVIDGLQGPAALWETLLT